MPAENNKSSQPAAIPVICGQKISVDFGQRKAVITIVINFNFTIMLLTEIYFLFSVLDKLIFPISAIGLRNY